MKRLTFTVAVLLTASVGHARVFHEVRMPDTVTISGKEVKLNGMGLRKKFVFDVYVAGLYVESPSRDAAQILASDQVRRITLFMLRDLSKDKIIEALREGFEKNAKEQMPAWKDRLDQLAAMIPDAKKGSTIVITYLPGTGTMLSTATDRSVIPGKDFADALFSVWLGQYSVDDGLKKGLLGG
jgi:Chalcone isomerase-like